MSSANSGRSAVLITVTAALNLEELRQHGFVADGDEVPLSEGSGQSVLQGTVPAGSEESIQALRGVLRISPNSDMSLYAQSQ